MSDLDPSGGPSVTDNGGQGMTYQEALEIAQRGFARWASKPHNGRWFRRIDGTPIPNDLVVTIAEEFRNAANGTTQPLPSTGISGQRQSFAKIDESASERSLIRKIGLGAIIVLGTIFAVGATLVGAILRHGI